MNISNLSKLERDLKTEEYIVIDNNNIYVCNRKTKSRKFIDKLTSGINPIEIDNNSDLFKTTSMSGLISLNSVPDDYGPQSARESELPLCRAM